MPDRLAQAITEGAGGADTTPAPASFETARTRLLKQEDAAAEGDPNAEGANVTTAEEDEDPNADTAIYDPPAVADDAADTDDEDAEETDEAEAAAPEKGKAGKLVSFEVPTPRLEGTKFTDADGNEVVRPPRGGGILVFEGISQEAADTLAFHVGQSKRVPRLEQQIGEAQEDAATIEFIRTHTPEAIYMLTENRPEIAEGFVENWVLRNPAKALKLVQAHKLDQEQDPEMLRLKGKEAERDARDRMQEGFRTVQLSVAEQRYADRATDVVIEMGETLKLESEEYSDFVALASSRLQDAFTQAPRASKGQMVGMLQSLVRRFTRDRGSPSNAPGTTRTATGSAVPPPTPAARMSAKVATGRKHAKIGTGRSPIVPAGVVKLKQGATLDDVSAALRKS